MKRGNGEDDSDQPGGPVTEAATEAEATGLSPTEPRSQASPEGLRDELEALRAERDELKDRLLRRAADFENYRRRVERDGAQAGQEATVGVFKALIPTLDNLDHALKAEAGEQSLREGVELTRRDLLATLEAKGLVVEDPVGQKFDPARHEALAHEPTPGFEDGDVVEVLRKGYSFQDRLLRPALVKVAKGEKAAGGRPKDKVH